MTSSRIFQRPGNNLCPLSMPVNPVSQSKYDQSFSAHIASVSLGCADTGTTLIEDPAAPQRISVFAPTSCRESSTVMTFDLISDSLAVTIRYKNTQIRRLRRTPLSAVDDHSTSRFFNALRIGGIMIFPLGRRFPYLLKRGRTRIIPFRLYQRQSLSLPLNVSVHREHLQFTVFLIDLKSVDTHLDNSFESNFC